jgi:hypothetical protein
MRIRRLTPTQERLAGVALGAIVAVPVWLWLTPIFFSARTTGDPLRGAAVFTYPIAAVVITAVVGLVLIAAGLRLGLDRQFWNFALVGAGAGLLLFGTTWFATARLEITPDHFKYRSWWGLSTTRMAFTDLEEVRLHQRDWSIWGRRRGLALSYRTRDGEVGTLCDNTFRNPLWLFAGPHVIRMTRAAQ